MCGMLMFMISIEFLRQYRFGKYAIFDFVASLAGIYLLAPLLSKIFLKFNIYIPRKNWLFLTIPISIPIHFLVGNITPMTRDFMDIHSNYLLKILILVLVLLGIRGIKIIGK